MTAPVNAFQTNFGRFYAHPSASRPVSVIGMGMAGPVVDTDAADPYAPKPSITNIIGMLDKAFLPPYYAKLVAEYAVGNIAGIQNMIERFGPQVAIGNLKAVPNQQHKNAAIGDEVHAWIDALIKDEPAPLLTSHTAYNMCAQFTNFLEQARPDIIRTEYTVWSYTHGYAGTGDLLWRLWGGAWVVDTKTGTSIHPEVAMQTSAIAHADVILDAQGNEHPMPATDILGVLHVRPRSVKLHKLERGEESFKAFLGLKQAFDWKRFYAETLIQEPFKTEKPKEG